MALCASIYPLESDPHHVNTFMFLFVGTWNTVLLECSTVDLGSQFWASTSPQMGKTSLLWTHGAFEKDEKHALLVTCCKCKNKVCIGVVPVINVGVGIGIGIGIASLPQGKAS